MYVMLNRRTLARINDRPRGWGAFVYAALGAVVAAAACAFLLSYVIGGAVLLAGGGLAYLSYRRDAEARVVELHYDLGGAATGRFSVVRAACEALAGAEGIWRVEEVSGEPDAGFVGAIPGKDAAPRRPVEVGRLETPGISANVDVRGIRAGDTSLFFLPECVLVYEDDRYRAVSYEAFGVMYAPSRVAETGEVPADAEVVGETWRYVTEGGGPDRRRSSNPRYPIVAYGMLAMTGLAAGAAGPGGSTRAAKSGLRLLVSNKASAVRFARAFGAGRDEGRDRDEHDTAHETRARRNAEAEFERSGSLFKVLGVEPDASRAEISAAYKQKARMYHPDRVATLAPEVREAAEIRMKEINAAYGELKRRGS